MNWQRIEARVLEIVERVTNGGRTEDDFVECKSKWPDQSRAARRIAAISNAARGEDVMWLIGLDENGHRVVALDATDPGNWWGSVESKFADGVAPSVRMRNIPTDQGMVVCLYFETDRSPYVVNVDPNTAGGLTREVPWRDGTRTRTAKRHELLSLMSAVTAVPELELLQPKLTFGLERRPDRFGDFRNVEGERVLEFEAVLFIDSEDRVLLPRHRWATQFVTIDGVQFDADIEFSRHVVTDYGKARVEPEHAYGVAVRTAGLLVTGPDSVILTATAKVPADVATSRLEFVSWVEVFVQLPTNGTGRTAVARQRLCWSSGHNEPGPETAAPVVFATWSMPRH
ncbi:AlbA family DNA-binding domain-containing protein [Nocardia violaceofusca]|uniref:AlbA family DNA-binding domain-containing protein n=1 Tax=Nocardia violaceofusca TaxID=941182 RepID=UPI0007A4021A|nr:hypothetical protein [Nocardia violaceofusca]